jgi:hypothetical protein
MTVKFIENESYVHKMAKEVLKKWFEETEIDDYMGIGDIRFRPNRKSGIFLEYPICNVECEKSNSWKSNWDEIAGRWGDEYVPTYDECVNIYNTYPIAIIDVVCSHKGSPSIGIEICYKNPVSQEKINKLQSFGVHRLIEIDAEWILQQTKRPSKLKYRQLI